MKSADQFGFSVKDIKIDIKKIVERSQNVSKQLSGGIGHLLKKNKVTTIMGMATLKGKGELAVNKKVYKADHIILATGARPRILPGLEPDGN